MAAAAADRFAALPDDVLVRVISFLPVRDAARTAILSRRWRPLWRLSDTVNLDSRSYDCYPLQIRKRLFAHAAAALWRRVPVRRLSLFVQADRDDACQIIFGGVTWEDWNDNVLDQLLRSRALRKLEELQIGFEFSERRETRFIYVLCYKDLPSHTLRVLDIDCCDFQIPEKGKAEVLFPRLISLRLKRCLTWFDRFEALTRGAPNLSTLHIESPDVFCIDSKNDRLVLHCPNLTTLSLLDLTLDKPAVQVYAPLLRTFRYNGQYIEFSMESDATNLTQVDLKFCSYPAHRNANVPVPVLLRQFLGSLRHTKVLKLHLLSIDDLVIGNDMQHDQHMDMLHSLKHLELEARFDPDRRNDAASAIAALLHCCPVVSDIYLRLHTDGSKDTPDFDVSMDSFKRRRTEEITRMLDGDYDSSECHVPDLHGLTGCWFKCLHSHLKRVKLQFDLKEPNSFEVCLAKFFAENCKVLEVLQIDGGSQILNNHINRRVEKWRLSALQEMKHKRNLLSKGNAE